MIRAHRTVVLMVASLAMTGCDPYCSTRTTSPRAGVGVKRIRDALAADAELKITREIDGDSGGRWIGGHRSVISWWCERGGIITCVHITSDPDEIEVAVGQGRRPAPATAAQWDERVEYVRAALGRSFPQLGPWRLRRYDELDWGSPEFWGGSGVSVALLGALIWSVRRRARRASQAT